MTIASLLVSWLLALCLSHGSQARDSAVELSAVPGAVETVEGSPVGLSQARRVLLRPASIPDGSQEFVVRGEVRVENTSGRAIRRLNLSLCYGGNQTMCIAVDRIGAGEVRDYVNEKFHVKGGPAPTDHTLTLTVRPTGAEFEDGTHWAAPRTDSSRLPVRSLHQSLSPLIIRQYDLRVDTYAASLWATDPQMAAYRLALVKDTPDSFEVRLGNWVALTGDGSDRGRTFTDSGQSIPTEQMFPRQVQARTLPDGKVITESFGVAIFVAEVRFANGRVWRQDLTRDALLWDN